MTDEPKGDVPEDRTGAKYALDIRPDGKVILDGIVCGRIEESDDGGLRLTLNLGWCREAGFHVKLLADPEVDRHRDGVVLER